MAALGAVSTGESPSLLGLPGPTVWGTHLHLKAAPQEGDAGTKYTL